MIYAILHRWGAEPFEWGYHDCTTVIADWVLAVRGFDPMADIRGTYGNPELCPVGRRMRAEPMPIWDEALSSLPVVESAATGDVALVELTGHRFLCGALRLDARNWAMKHESRGVMITRAARPVKIWGCQYEA